MKPLFFEEKTWNIVVVMLLASLASRAQSRLPTGYVEVGGRASSTRQTPFWLRANQFGTVPGESPVGSLRLGAHLDYCPDTLPRQRRFDWGFGAEVVGNGGATRQLLLPEAYAKIRYGAVELWAGRRREVLGIMDTTLTSGGISWSGNALSVPKIQLTVPDYLPLKFLGSFVALKGFYAHGWFNAPYIRGAYLHQKALYGRFGKPAARLHLHVGLVHHVQWGGEADYLKTSPFAVDGKLTTDFRDYLRGVVLGKISDEQRNGRYTGFDGENRIGNHVGHYDIAFDLHLRGSSILFYNQHPFEDTSGLLFLNLPDGLYGLSWRNDRGGMVGFRLRRVLLEWLYTKNQAGSSFDIAGSRFKGGDNYFNHSQYAEGWSYFSQGLGTPFLPLISEVVPNLASGGLFFPNNRVEAYHAGAEALLNGRVLMVVKLSYSRNFGTYSVPFSEAIPQFSSLLDVRLPVAWLGGADLTGRVAWDTGRLYPPTFGAYLGLRKTWNAGRLR
ncbi:MAG: hypothetical protein H7Y12_15635 [Sphingobacteriaceae bacterium]|nr:hypothetical protein [Cytophagaceae bacterium]